MILRLAAWFLKVEHVNRRIQWYWPFAATRTGMDRSMAPLESHLPKAINNGPSSIWKSLAAT